MAALHIHFCQRLTSQVLLFFLPQLHLEWLCRAKHPSKPQWIAIFTGVCVCVVMLRLCECVLLAGEGACIAPRVFDIFILIFPNL